MFSSLSCKDQSRGTRRAAHCHGYHRARLSWVLPAPALLLAEALGPAAHVGMCPKIPPQQMPVGPGRGRSPCRRARGDAAAAPDSLCPRGAPGSPRLSLVPAACPGAEQQCRRCRGAPRTELRAEPLPGAVQVSEGRILPWEQHCSRVVLPGGDTHGPGPPRSAGLGGLGAGRRAARGHI